MMDSFAEHDVSRAILDAYHRKFQEALQSEVVIVGAGPSGLVAAWHLAEKNLRVVVLEKRLSPGGGIWGGSMGMNEIVVQEEAVGLLDAAGVRHQAAGGLHTADAGELACALGLRAVQSGAVVLNLLAAEDLCVRAGRVRGVVANRTLLGDSLPIDPMVFSTQAVIDATGHEAFLVDCLRRRGLLEGPSGRRPGEGPMDAPAGERFVVEHVGQVYPGLWTAGMSVCAALGGPRMGPIFGGMLLSGTEAAGQIAAALRRMKGQEKPR